MEYLDRAETLKTFLNSQEEKQASPTNGKNGAAKTKKVYVFFTP